MKFTESANAITISIMIFIMVKWPVVNNVMLQEKSETFAKVREGDA